MHICRFIWRMQDQSNLYASVEHYVYNALSPSLVAVCLVNQPMFIGSRSISMFY